MLPTGIPGPSSRRLLALALGLTLIAGFSNPGQRSASAANQGTKSVATGNIAEIVKIIDEGLESGWAKNKITPSAACDDHEFIRRASLDIIGRIAKPEEIKEFLSDSKETRRSKLIDRLLASEDYARNWANIWCNWLLTRSGIFGRGTYHDQMTIWLEDQFAQNKSYDAIVKALISAKGKNTENGAANFILAHLGETIPGNKTAEEGRFEMVPVTSRITRLFLGVQAQCAQCHDHPFDGNIRQRDFWGVNAFLRQVDRGGTPPVPRGGMMMAYSALELKDNPEFNNEAAVFYEKRNGVIEETKAVFLRPSMNKPESADNKAMKLAGTDRRFQLASFVTEHPNFPKAVVNRMWAHFFGRGFTDPVDDFQEQNQPSNPELLQELGDQFKHYGYDFKTLIRWICNSRAYGLSSVANKTNAKSEQEPLFGRMLLKSMSPEQLFESLMIATQAEANESKDGKKTLREQWEGNLIANFGDDEGNEVSFNGTVVQALLMMNGKDINDAISRKDKGTVALAMAKKSTPAAVIRSLYLASLNREPTQHEMTKIMNSMKLLKTVDKDPAAPYQDLFWALLNSNEFLLNH